MTICELEAKFKLGPIELGEKIGRVINPGEEVILRDTNFNPALRSATLATVQTPDKVLIEWYSGDKVISGQIRQDSEINDEPALKGKLCWIPTSE
jgi:hypothetical protein